jgi:hypothetical protein
MILALLAYIEHMLVCHLWSSISALIVIQIVINELNTLTPDSLLLNVASSKVEIKQKELSVADKLDIIKKVDT